MLTSLSRTRSSWQTNKILGDSAAKGTILVHRAAGISTGSVSYLYIESQMSVDALMNITARQEVLLSEGDSTHVIELGGSLFERDMRR